MPRKPRVQFPGAIFHVVTRGDGRRELFHEQEKRGQAKKGVKSQKNERRGKNRVQITQNVYRLFARKWSLPE